MCKVEQWVPIKKTPSKKCQKIEEIHISCILKFCRFGDAVHICVCLHMHVSICVGNYGKPHDTEMPMAVKECENLILGWEQLVKNSTNFLSCPCACCFFLPPTICNRSSEYTQQPMKEYINTCLSVKYYGPPSSKPAFTSLALLNIGSSSTVCVYISLVWCISLFAAPTSIHIRIHPKIHISLSSLIQ